MAFGWMKCLPCITINTKMGEGAWSDLIWYYGEVSLTFYIPQISGHWLNDPVYSVRLSQCWAPILWQAQGPSINYHTAFFPSSSPLFGCVCSISVQNTLARRDYSHTSIYWDFRAPLNLFKYRIVITFVIYGKKFHIRILCPFKFVLTYH